MTTIVEGAGEPFPGLDVEHEQELRRLKSVRLVRQPNPKPRRLAWHVEAGYDLEIMLGHDVVILDTLPPGVRSGFRRPPEKPKSWGMIFIIDLYKADATIDPAEIQRQVEALTWGEQVF